MIEKGESVGLLFLSGCINFTEPMAGFMIINTESEDHRVEVEITSENGNSIYSDEYMVDMGSRREERELFESQVCVYNISVDDGRNEEYQFYPSCTNSDDVHDNLNIALNDGNIEFYPRQCGD
ncbi:hypothetical protein [Halostagnicola kamekurae]|uniref:hypothetical protein n=1 Tax=Halostagnicola kamekurae TaxID=619731 RepID=UPI001113EACF|nr:hypothetical protein [Halostagnicola kamekurae]